MSAIPPPAAVGQEQAAPEPGASRVAPFQELPPVRAALAKVASPPLTLFHVLKDKESSALFRISGMAGVTYALLAAARGHEATRADRWTEGVQVLAQVLMSMAASVTSVHRERAQATLTRWLGTKTE